MKKGFIARLKADPLSFIVGLLAFLYGVLFFITQTSKLFSPESAEADMLKEPFGLFDWGFVWADTVFLGLMLLIGGILLLFLSGDRARRLGHLLAFAGFAMNLYATIFFVVGLQAAGEPMSGGELAVNTAFAFVGLLCMIWSAVVIAGKPSRV
jgi:hypothetical protein